MLSQFESVGRSYLKLGGTDRTFTNGKMISWIHEERRTP